nr:replication initiation protein [Microvirus sp.]
MSCYHPSRMIAFADPKSGEIQYKMIGRAVDLPGDQDVLNAYDPTYVRAYNVPCRKCIGCRLDYSRNWANRMLLEYYANGKKAVFITLTYRPEDVPFSDVSRETMTLRKKDCQDFMKRLRWNMPLHPIRFYLSGEYGPQTHRPHYHAILFGLTLYDFLDARPLKTRSETGCTMYTSCYLENIWSHGFVSIEEANYKTFAYVARYMLKKQFKQDARKDCVPEFSLCSRRPGIGAPYLQQHAISLDNQTFQMYNGGTLRKFPIPSNLLNSCKEVSPDLLADIKLCRQELAEEKMRLELAKTDLSLPVYLKVKETYHESRARVLHNRKEF